MNDQELLQMVAGQWDVYNRADWSGKLGLLRHDFSMNIDRVDDRYEYLHILVDGKTRQDYQIAKPVGARAEAGGSSVGAFVRFVFDLQDGETKSFTWRGESTWSGGSTRRAESTRCGDSSLRGESGEYTWFLSRRHWSLYVEAPKIAEGFFIRYGDFRDECLAAYEKVYGWGYEADICRVEVPEKDYLFLRNLDLENEFELVRFLDDGHSFETTDLNRLLHFIDACREAEEDLEDPDQEHLSGLHDLYESVQYYAAERKQLKRAANKLSSSIGMNFTWMKDNWEECDFFYNLTGDPDDRHDAVYRRYGKLPGGRHFGAYFWPKSEAWPETSVMMIVSKNGKMRVNTVIDGRWDARFDERWPLAAAASPSGKCIVWLKDGELWVWHEDRDDKRFLPDDGKCLKSRLGDCRVWNAYMSNEGILVLDLEGEEKKHLAYLCDEDIVLTRWQDWWIPANESETSRAKGQLSYWPDSFAVKIRKEDANYEYYECGIRRVCFDPELEVINIGMLAGNPDLESVTIPASVKEVQAWAFGLCTNLKNLVIEGDPSRVVNWARDAFEGCACEEEYLRLRIAGQRHDH